MKNQSKSIQDAPLLCHHHLLFQFLLHNRMFCPVVMFTPVLSNSSSDISDIALLIILRKGKRIYTSHHMSNFVSYSHLSSFYSAFISFMNS